MSAPDSVDRTQQQRMLAGELYQADDPLLQAAARRACQLAKQYDTLYYADLDAAQAVLGQLLGELGEGVQIKPPLFVDYGSSIRIGADTFINYGLVALDVAAIHIGRDVQIGPNVQLLTPTHPVQAEPRRQKWEAARPITIGDNVWLGGGAIVMPGITIGENTAVGAGAVVTRDLPPNVVAVGNPARVVRQIEP
jgi:maltose O-acetyltransferase